MNKLIGEFGYMNLRQLRKNQSWSLEDGYVLKEYYEEFISGKLLFNIVSYHTSSNGEIVKRTLKLNQINHGLQKDLKVVFSPKLVMIREVWGHNNQQQYEEELVETMHEKIEVTSKQMEGRYWLYVDE